MSNIINIATWMQYIFKTRQNISTLVVVSSCVVVVCDAVVVVGVAVVVVAPKDSVARKILQNIQILLASTYISKIYHPSRR